MLNRTRARMLAAEFVGTFALVFAGCGAVMVDAKTHALGHVGVAFTFGLVIMAMIYAVGHISGAHFNPAVTFAYRGCAPASRARARYSIVVQTGCASKGPAPSPSADARVRDPDPEARSGCEGEPSFAA